MNTQPQPPQDVTALTAKIVGSMLLGKIPMGNRPRASFMPEKINSILSPIKKLVGDEAFKSLETHGRPMMHCVLDTLLDAVTDVKRTETKESLKKLSVPQRTMVESILQNMTGRLREDNRWNDDLFSTRKKLRVLVNGSISELSMEDIRAGYHELAHAILDFYLDNLFK